MLTPTLWNIPYQRNPYFTGREDVLAALRRALHTENRVALSHPLGISGLGGIGKTQTALEYACRYRTEYNAIFWVRADSTIALTSSLFELANVLQLPERNAQDQEITIQAVLRWFRLHPNWLLIYDNIDDFSVAEPFLPKAGLGHLLFTTRAHAFGEFAQRLDIQKMEPDIGALLLLRRATLLALEASLNMVNPDDQSIARAISQELDGLPLALDQAGAYLKEAPCPLSDYLIRYQTRRSEILREKSRSSDQGYPDSVATTWSLSFEKIRQTNSAAVELLSFCAYLAPDAIPEAMIIKGAQHLPPLLQQAVVHPLQFDQAIASLLAYSLLHRNTDETWDIHRLAQTVLPLNKTISMHRLVQTVLRDGMDREQQCVWVERAAQSINSARPDEDAAKQYEMHTYLPHMISCESFRNEWNIRTEGTITLLKGIIKYSYLVGNFSSCISFANQALEMQIEDAEFYLWRGMAFKDKKDYISALNDMTHALRLAPNNIWVYVHRALVHIENKDYQHALDDLNIAISLQISLYSNNTSVAAWIHVHRALLYVRNKDYERALDDMNAAISLNPSSYWVHAHRARLYGRLNDYQRALDDMNTAVSLNPNDAWVHVHRALLCVESKDYEHALDDMNAAIALDPSSYWAHIHRARLYGRLNDYQRALDDMNTAIALNPNNAWAHVQRALVYRGINNYQQALQGLNRALELDSLNIEYLIYRAVIHRDNEEYQSALRNLDYVLAINTREAQAYIERALTYKAITDYQQALQDLNSASEITPEYVRVYAERGALYLLMGNMQRAQADIERSRVLDLANGQQSNQKEPWYDYT